MAINTTSSQNIYFDAQLISPIARIFFGPLEIVVAFASILVLFTYFKPSTRWLLSWRQLSPKGDLSKADSDGSSDDDSRNIIAVLAKNKKSCVVFYGSQTGTAEEYARRLVKESSERFGLKAMIADLEEYDHRHLSQLPEDAMAIFVLATHGEGEPTDNAVEFWNLITADEPSFLEDGSLSQPLSQLRFATFGLGNKNYEKFNAVAVTVDSALEKLGGRRIGCYEHVQHVTFWSRDGSQRIAAIQDRLDPERSSGTRCNLNIGLLGLGDDATNSTEEDFLTWKESMWSAAVKQMRLTESAVTAKSTLRVTETDSSSFDRTEIYLGELSKDHMEAEVSVPYSASNPYAASIVQSKELFFNSNRKCLHLEIDLQHSGLTYTTGDHLAVWPMNSEREIHRFLSVFGLDSKASQIIKIESLDSMMRLPFPSPTTYGTAARHYLEICGPVSRSFLAQLANFAPNSAGMLEMQKLGSNKEYFQQRVAHRYLNLAQVCEMVVPGLIWPNVPYAILIEGLNRLKPRYYSISSSSIAQNSQLSVTVVVDEISVPGESHTLKGVATNYLLALKEQMHSAQWAGPATHALSGPRDLYQGVRIPVHLRTSTFRLPQDPLVPIIMVGPGTGVAPFRGFLQERATQARSGIRIGKMTLFFGCRSAQEDFLYAEEWKQYEEALSGQFQLVTAFSRQGPSKVYVQHRLMERAADIGSMLLQHKAQIYVCGDAANMAGEVNRTFIQIISQAQKRGQSAATDMITAMRRERRYQEDIW